VNALCGGDKIPSSDLFDPKADTGTVLRNGMSDTVSILEVRINTEVQVTQSWCLRYQDRGIGREDESVSNRHSIVSVPS
jgi:hypothetical protein